MKKSLGVLIFALLFPLTAAFAVKVNSLYEVRLPVMTQQEEDRIAAEHDGFLQVLVKLSGDPEIQKNPAIKAALKRAEYYVLEYGYEPPVSTEANYTIRIKFDKDDIRRLLKKSSVAYWGEKRPLILVWLVTTNLNEDYQIVGSEAVNTILESFKKESKVYGLPVIFPMMDMADMELVTTDDVASMNIASLNTAGRRYSPDALLIGKVVDNKHEFASRWLLVKNGYSWEWTLSNTSVDAMFGELLNQVRQILSKQMALVPPDAEQAPVTG